ncbi:hypothetical protein ACJMK2_033859 [Sinanodonta woodiana]|uniref:Uncharacterized protein n=1 Tax=Sinanodonta woodiana TaxID=1069815 RepID=A0ABD3WPR5_SINWO
MATMYYRPYTSEPIKDGEMPPIDAMENILPEYQYIFYDPKGPQGPTARSLPGMSTRIPPPQSPSRGYQAEDLDMSTMTILDHQGKELDNYRSAVFKMGQDIIELRQQVRDLEANNSNLRRNLANYNDAGRLMLETSELEGLTKPEILSRYAAIKQTLSAQTADMKLYKDKVQILQNQLIKKNDDEKKYLQLQKAHNQQQAVVLKMQDKLQKMKKMEEALKKQESVIEKMEKVIEKYHKDRSKTQKDKDSHEANEVLLQENKRLRDQMIEMREQLRVAGRGGDDIEKLELYQALEKAEGRINSLEKQLSENAKLWGRERADMSIKLNEAEHGFGRSTGMVLHDYPVYGERFGKTTQKRLSPMYR